MVNMKKYWKEFYMKNEAPEDPSDFALSFLNREQDLSKESCFELGAGNCRDSYILNSSFKKFTAFDYAADAAQPEGITLLCEDLSETLKRKCPGVVYSRFFLHCLSNNEIKKLLDWTQKYFVAEFRIKGDVPVLYKHDRNLVDLSWLLKEMLERNFEFTLRVGRGLAKHKKEDPLVARIYAKKKNR